MRKNLSVLTWLPVPLIDILTSGWKGPWAASACSSSRKTGLTEVPSNQWSDKHSFRRQS
jgi:hypothetical protein